MKKCVCTLWLVFFLVLWGSGSVFADVTPIPIGAETAFDAVQTQTDPNSGLGTRIALVDVRTKAEYFWVGAACKVDEILTISGDIIAPDLGKVILSQSGRFMNYELSGTNKNLLVSKVAEISLSPIALNIPYRYWDEASAELVINPNFSTAVEALASDYDVLIFFCRSGGRSENCLADFDTTLFDGLYEIDQPDGKNGRGGFEGTSYGNVYNGYRGFPERLTGSQPHPSVAWKDAGLPIKTGLKP